MKIISERKHYRFHNGCAYTVYVTEAATNWYVTIQQAGWALPQLLDYKIAKKDCKTDMEAINIALNQI